MATAIQELRRWQARRKEMLTDFDEATREYAELAHCLRGTLGLSRIRALNVNSERRR